MRKSFSFAVFFVVVAMAMNLSGAARAKDGSFRFVIMGDSRPILPNIDQAPQFKQILWETDLIGPELGFHVGDLVFGYMSHEGELARQYQDLKRVIDPVETPMHYAIGNHEIGSSGGEKEYKETVGELYYSFDFEGSHFIIMNTDWGDKGDTGTLGAEQLAWLEKDLKNNKGAKNIFAFMHKPMFDRPTGPGSSWNDLAMRDKVHKMFLDNGNVRGVFSGHIHVYRKFVRDGIPHYITGGAGAESDNPDHEGFFHYLLAEVDGTTMNIKVVEPYRLWYQCEPECNGKNPEVKVTMLTTLYSLLPIWIKGIQINMPAPPEGKTYGASGGHIRASKKNSDGTITLKITVNMNNVVGYKYIDVFQTDK